MHSTPRSDVGKMELILVYRVCNATVMRRLYVDTNIQIHGRMHVFQQASVITCHHLLHLTMAPHQPHQTKWT